MDNEKPEEDALVLVPTDDEPDNDNDREAQGNTLLPRHLAALISLGTATSSLSLRFASFLGNAAVNTARLGTLTGFEVGRSVLETILARAGQDVVETSNGAMGRAAAESVLSSALNSLHYAITNTSFLLSAGFQLGTIGINTSTAVAQSLLNLLDAVFGDTDTSKAIATIITMVQREYGTHEVQNTREKISTRDIITGAIAFVLLQRWSRQKTQEALEEEGVERSILDIVVLAQSQPSDALASSPQHSPREGHARPASRMSARPASFISPTAGSKPFDAISYNDGASFYSQTTLQHMASQLMPETQFRQALLPQLQPGTSVRITSTTTTTNYITVEISGDATSWIQPPPGYELVSADGQLSFGDDGQTLVFQSTQETNHAGDFEIEHASQSSDEETADASGPMLLDEKASTSHHQGTTSDGPVAANQKRRRSIPAQGNADVDSPTFERRKTIRQALKGRTSYRNLLDFWNGGPGRTSKPTDDLRAARNIPPNGNGSNLESLRPLSSLRQGSSLSPSGPKNPFSFEPSEMITGPQANHSRRSTHRKRPSSVFTVETTSNQSVVLHTDARDVGVDRALQIARDGTLPGQYPLAPFAKNAARFSRFAAAAYGERFLRLTGSLTTADSTALMSDRQQLTQHITFSNYTGLPASTVLLSSFVDPQGGPNAAGQAETGLPLIHYISVDHESKAVVITFRGTLGFEDILTDLTADYDDLIWEGKAYQVHQGILASARRLLTIHAGRSIATIKAALEEFEDYGLVLCGHSLGGAVAAVLAILLAQRNPSTVPGASKFITKVDMASRLLIQATGLTSDSAQETSELLPPGRPIHVYAFGPAATISPELQLETRGLITTIINDTDYIPYLSLGTLRDMHAIAYAFKTDTSGAKAEVKRRVWQGTQDILRDRTGMSAFGGPRWFDELEPEDDHWPWIVLKSLRAGMIADKLVPPGEVFVVKSEPVLQRYAFVHDPTNDKRTDHVGTQSCKPATHVKLQHISDVAKRFGEVRFGSSMFTDHLPARYEKVLQVLERGVGLS